MRFFAYAQNDSFLQTFANYLKPPPSLVTGEVGNSLANWSEGAAFPSARVFRNDRSGDLYGRLIRRYFLSKRVINRKTVISYFLQSRVF